MFSSGHRPDAGTGPGVVLAVADGSALGVVEVSAGPPDAAQPPVPPPVTRSSMLSSAGSVVVGGGVDDEAEVDDSVLPGVESPPLVVHTISPTMTATTASATTPARMRRRQ